MSTIQPLKDMEDLNEAARVLGEMIHLAGPAPEAVTRRAISDDRYALHLMMTRDIPELQRQVLGLVPSDVRAAASAPHSAGPGGATEPKASPPPSTTELLGRASEALVRWGRGGFKKASEEAQKRRMDACLACPNLADPPKTMLYQGLKLLAGRDTKICAACGCAVNRKTALPTERCPVQDPSDPGLSRWGEPWVELRRK